jgi:hypothetical protein
MLNWYVVRTIVQREARSELRLRECGYQTYLPRAERARTGQKPDRVPLFPGYFFLHTDWPTLTPRERGWDVLQVLDQSVPDEAMDELWARETAEGVILLPKTRIFEPFQPGVTVEVWDYGSSFFGQQGLVQGMSGGDCVSVLLSLLGRPFVRDFKRADVRVSAVRLAEVQ